MGGGTFSLCIMKLITSSFPCTAKHRSRKNSTNAQQRARNRQLPPSLVLGRPTLSAIDRQNSHDSKTSPLHDPPSYNQAMKGTGVVLSPSYVTRSRSLSESVSSSSRSARSAQVVSKPLKPEDLGPRKKGQRSSPLGKDNRNVASPHQDTAHQDTTNQATSYVSSRGDDDRTYTGSPRLAVEGMFEARTRESEGDFARNVRGTSTPIDVSPSLTPSQVHSYSEQQRDEGGAEARGYVYSLTSEEILRQREGLELGGVAGVGHGGEGESMARRSPRHEAAIESEESREDGGLCETS